MSRILTSSKLAKNGASPRSTRLTLNETIKGLLNAEVGDTIGFFLDNGKIYIEKVESS